MRAKNLRTEWEDGKSVWSRHGPSRACQRDACRYGQPKRVEVSRSKAMESNLPPGMRDHYLGPLIGWLGTPVLQRFDL